MIRAFFRTWKLIKFHPLASRDKAGALRRWVCWQIGSRILKHPVVMPFVENSVLAVERGMTGATGNIYCGLHEFADMAFVLHVLRPGDLFLDLGANIGSYTVLAAKVAGADCLTLEPVPATFARGSSAICESMTSIHAWRRYNVRLGQAPLAYASLPI